MSYDELVGHPIEAYVKGKWFPFLEKTFVKFIDSSVVSEYPAILVLLGSYGLFLFLQETFLLYFSLHQFINMYPEMATTGDTLIPLYRCFAALAWLYPDGRGQPLTSQAQTTHGKLSCKALCNLSETKDRAHRRWPVRKRTRKYYKQTNK